MLRVSEYSVPTPAGTGNNSKQKLIWWQPVRVMERFRYIFMFILVGILLTLLYFIFFQEKKNINNIESLLHCIELQDCKGKNCPPLPDYCPRNDQQPQTADTHSHSASGTSDRADTDSSAKNEGSSGIKTIEDSIKEETAKKDSPDKEGKSQSLLEKLLSNIKTVEDKPAPAPLPEHRRSNNKYSDTELKKAIERQKRINERKSRKAKIKHKERKQLTLAERIDFTFIEIGFSYTLRNVFVVIPLIAFGMSLAALGLKQSAQTYGLLAVALAVSSAFVGDTVLKNYDYLGPYLYLLSGASLLLFAEQKEYILPILGAIIGVLIGFTAGADSPINDKWPFIIGVIFACGFVLMIFSISTQLFNQTWSETIMNILGGGLIALALIMFALEMNGNTSKYPHADKRSDIRIFEPRYLTV